MSWHQHIFYFSDYNFQEAPCRFLNRLKDEGVTDFRLCPYDKGLIVFYLSNGLIW